MFASLFYSVIESVARKSNVEFSLETNCSSHLIILKESEVISLSILHSSYVNNLINSANKMNSIMMLLL